MSEQKTDANNWHFNKTAKYVMIKAILQKQDKYAESLKTSKERIE